MFIIKKRNKYFAGTSYATGLGTSHSWSTDKDDAQIFLYKDQAEYKAVETHGKVFEIVWREKQKKKKYQPVMNAQKLLVPLLLLCSN